MTKTTRDFIREMAVLSGWAPILPEEGRPITLDQTPFLQAFGLRLECIPHFGKSITYSLVQLREDQRWLLFNPGEWHSSLNYLVDRLRDKYDNHILCKQPDWHRSNLETKYAQIWACEYIEAHLWDQMALAMAPFQDQFANLKALKKILEK